MSELKMRSEMIRVWSVEDNVFLSEGLRRVLSSMDDMEFAGGFSTAEAAIERLEEGWAAPDVILLDVQLPGIEGIEALECFSKLAPESRVVILTVFDDADKIFRAISAGAAGYLLKSAGIDRIGDTIRQVMAGGAPMTPAVARKVLDAFSSLKKSSEECEDYHLTEREREILKLLADGLLKKEIADQLRVSQHTVSTHLRRVYVKLRVTTNTGAVAKALRERII